MLLPNIRACTRPNTLRTRDGGGGDPSPLSRVPSGGLSPPPHPTLPPQRGTGTSSRPQLRHLPLGGNPQLRVSGERDSQKVSQPSSKRAGKSGRGRRKLARPTPTPARGSEREPDTTQGFGHHSQVPTVFEEASVSSPAPSPPSSGTMGGRLAGSRPPRGLPTSTSTCRRGRSRLQNGVVSALGEGAAGPRGAGEGESPF